MKSFLRFLPPDKRLILLGKHSTWGHDFCMVMNAVFDEIDDAKEALNHFHVMGVMQFSGLLQLIFGLAGTLSS